MNAVTDVLVKTQDMPEPPFDATLEYCGIEVTLRVAALVNEGELIKVVKNQPSIEDSTEFNTTYKILRSTQLDTIAKNVDMDNPVTHIKNISSRKKHNDDIFVAYKHDGQIYIVEPIYRFAYKIIPKETPRFYYGVESDEYEELPESTPQTRINGKIKEENGNIFLHASSFFKKIFGMGALKLYIDLKDSVIHYDRYELINNVDIGKNTNTAYNVASVDVEYNEFIITSEYNNKHITFKIPLTQFGTLPSWTEERLDASMLLSVIDADDTLMSQIKQADNPLSKWVGENGEYELIKIE